MKKILCASDPSEVSRRAEDYAVLMAKASGGELCFLHVNQVTPEDLTRPSQTDPFILETVEARASDVLARVEERIRKEGLKNTKCASVRSHNVGAAIIAYAEQEGFDHIVVGSNGRKGIPRFLLGSVSAAIVQRAHCPVTVIR